MKNINTIITSGLAIAVAVLFYLHFSSNKKSNAPINTKSQNGKPALIAYFEMDSIQSQYQYYKDVESELTKMKLELENNLSKKENENNNVLRAFQNKFKDINQSSSDVDKAAARQHQNVG